MNEDQLAAFYPLTLAIRRLFHQIGHDVAALHADRDISVGMRAVLESVIDGGPQTVPQMARARPVTRQHILALVNQLLDGGYVEYRDNPAHKRSSLVAATAKGEAAFRQMRDKELAAFRLAEIGATAAEFEVANKVLRALIATFDTPEWNATLVNQSSQAKE